MPRVILHFDVDSFYCEVRTGGSNGQQCTPFAPARLTGVGPRSASGCHLRGKPLAVTQHNRGGFVAVSYEAKACGVRKGDGIGDEGRRRLPGFRDRPGAAASRREGPQTDMAAAQTQRLTLCSNDAPR